LKRNNRNANAKKCRSFEKGTKKNPNVVPLEKEQQKPQVLFLWKRNIKKKSNVVPLEKEQQK